MPLTIFILTKEIKITKYFFLQKVMRQFTRRGRGCLHRKVIVKVIVLSKMNVSK